MTPRKLPVVPYAAPDEHDRDREPAQWWVLALILAGGAAIMFAVFLLSLT